MKTLHFISHTHWDREWYLPYQKLRYRLVQLIDQLLELLDHNPEFVYYYLDGQTILIEDYLEIKPQNEEKLKKYIKQGRIKIGPWYVLQDQYLTSGEANIRSLMLGIITGEKYGGVARIGYLPDAFGNISQTPQILNGFGISNAVFGRGIKPGCNQRNSNQYPSEIYWESPDGSRVLGIFMANWYDNANQLPENLKKSVKFIEKAKEDAERYATTNQLLMMNGCDHQPIQQNLPQILNKAQKQMTDQLLHSNLEDYIKAVEQEIGELPVVRGELNNQYTDGWTTLRNTASSRIYLKQMNSVTQNMLEKYVEPLETMAWLAGKTYEQEFIRQAWKYLLQNHAHDSICGCSVDDVHAEMVIRFKNSQQISEALLEKSTAYLLESGGNKHDSEGSTVTVFNTLNWPRTDLVEVVLTLPAEQVLNEIVLVDDNQRTIPVDIEDDGIVFNYELPDNQFRAVKYPRKYRLRFIGEEIPANGSKTYSIKKVKPSLAESDEDDLILANEYLTVKINQDGSFNIFDRQANCSYDNLNIYQDSGDIGNEYLYKAPATDELISTSGKRAEIKKIKSSLVETVYLIKQNLRLPQEGMKKLTRSKQYIDCPIETEISLRKKSRRVDIKTTFDNRVKDHRLRVLFPTNITTPDHYAEGQFDVLKRPNSPWTGWENPSNCYRQQRFIELNDGKRGLMIANKGLSEYEILPDQGNSIALTLLRAVGEMGDWGYFPTPEAQCIGVNSYEYSIIPHSTDWLTSKAFQEANAFNTALLGYQSSCSCREQSLFTVDADYLVLSALKKAEKGDSVIIRLYNIAEQQEELEFKSTTALKRVYLVNMNEERKAELNLETKKSFRDLFSAKQIKTYELIY